MSSAAARNFSAFLAAAPEAEQNSMLVEMLDSLIDTVGEDKVTSMLTALFDSTLGVYDIPKLPNFLEAPLKSMIRANIGPVVAAFHQKIHTP